MAINKVRLQDGSYIRRVSEERYLFYEQVRNYILRSRYERGTSLRMAKFKAMCKFDIDEKDIIIALKDWKRWYFGNLVRHRPIELFIRDNEERLKREESESKWDKWKGDENGKVSINIQ